MLKASVTHRWVVLPCETKNSGVNTGGCPYHVGRAVQVAVRGWARGHLATVGGQGEVDDTAQSLAILILHSLSAGCHGYLSICPPIWRGWSLGRHPGKKNGRREIERQRRENSEQYSRWFNRLMMELHDGGQHVTPVWRLWRFLWIKLAAVNS